MCYFVFDAPEVAGCWSKRIATAAKKLKCAFAAAVPWQPVDDLVHVSLYFRQVREQGGEGLILRRPGVPYSTRRNADVLKVKRCPITGELRWQERRATQSRVRFTSKLMGNPALLIRPKLGD